jgi:hypothetical protein
MIPNWEEKQYCYRCGEIENVAHIILHCEMNRTIRRKYGSKQKT